MSIHKLTKKIVFQIMDEYDLPLNGTGFLALGPILSAMHIWSVPKGVAMWESIYKEIQQLMGLGDIDKGLLVATAIERKVVYFDTEDGEIIFAIDTEKIDDLLT